MRPLLSRHCAALVLAFATATAPALAKPPHYGYVELAAPNGVPMLGTALNASGQATGSASPPKHPGASATVLASAEQFDAFAVLGSAHSVGLGLNDAGALVGTAALDGGTRTVAFVRAVDGHVVDIFAGHHHEWSNARGINASGLVVGSYLGPNGLETPYGWRNGHMRRLGDLGAGASAVAVNDAGDIVGTAIISDPGSLAVRWQEGRFDVFSALAPGGSSLATAVASDGTIAGESDAPGAPARHGTVWIDGIPVDLHFLDGGDATHPHGVNAWHQVVGSATTGGGLAGFLWQPSGLLDLNDLVDLPAGWRISDGVAINDAGQILALAVDGGGATRTLLLTQEGM